MDDDNVWSSEEEITKIPCKYGSSCYQKNPTHHEKFSHPVKKRRLDSPKTSETLKKQKNEDDTVRKQNKTNESTDTTVQKDNSINENSSDNDEWLNQINLLETFDDRKEFIKQTFLVEMPNDFYLFWDLCKEINKEKPKEAFKSVGLTLVGPYDILDESFQTTNVSGNQKYFLHWRYYYDPPEFQTIVKGDEKSGYHMGYFRDSPEEKPAFVAYNEANNNCTITQIGENIFGAMNAYFEKLLKTADPFKKMSITKLQKTVSNKAKELKLNLHSHGKSRKTVCKSFHTAGIVVPYNHTTQLGYRPLPVDEKELKKLLNQTVKAFAVDEEKAFSSMQSIITAATISNDECDFGTALEFGINMFCFGHHCFNTIILNLLKITYALLNRHAFAQIIEAHLKHRKKGSPHVINNK